MSWCGAGFARKYFPLHSCVCVWVRATGIRAFYVWFVESQTAARRASTPKFSNFPITCYSLWNGHDRTEPHEPLLRARRRSNTARRLSGCSCASYNTHTHTRARRECRIFAWVSVWVSSTVTETKLIFVCSIKVTFWIFQFFFVHPNIALSMFCCLIVSCIVVVLVTSTQMAGRCVMCSCECDRRWFALTIDLVSLEFWCALIATYSQFSCFYFIMPLSN